MVLRLLLARNGSWGFAIGRCTPRSRRPPALIEHGAVHGLEELLAVGAGGVDRAAVAVGLAAGGALLTAAGLWRLHQMTDE